MILYENLEALQVGDWKNRSWEGWYALIALGRAAAASASNGLEKQTFSVVITEVTFVELNWQKQKISINGNWPCRLEFWVWCDWAVNPTGRVTSCNPSFSTWGIHGYPTVWAKCLQRSPAQVKGNSLLPPALSHPQITAVGYFTNYFSVGLDAQTATWWLEGWKLLFLEGGLWWFPCWGCFLWNASRAWLTSKRSSGWRNMDESWQIWWISKISVDKSWPKILIFELNIHW